ncbi:hypothetical protein [Cupriavidus sp.]|uniref:hypothetical protein n=1 Tax=Cupriavidus sp. TaxID=1873897 RepID=UPI0031E40815
MKTVTIVHNGVTLRVTGDYSPAESQTWTDPGCDASFDVYKLMDRDVDVAHLHEDDMDEIEQLALQAIAEDDDYERERAADMRHEEQRLGALA